MGELVVHVSTLHFFGSFFLDIFFANNPGNIDYEVSLLLPA